MKTNVPIHKAVFFYSSLLQMYPKRYRANFEVQILQTFKDHYRDMYETEGNVGFDFWFNVVTDELKNILREQIISLKGGVTMKNSWAQQGILYGVILGIYHIIYNAINNIAPASVSLNNTLNSTIIIVPILCGIAGYSAARHAKNVKAGLYAGVLTGAMSMTIAVISLFIITHAFMNTISHNAFMIQDFHRSGVKSINQFIIEDAQGAMLVTALVSLFSGGVFGTMGGFIGRSILKKSK